MKFKKIVGFGDSWVWGDELLDPELINHEHAHPILMENTPYREQHCFLGLLGQHYNVPTENFGWPGGSDQSAQWCYLWWLEHESNPQDCLVLVGHTDANRTSFYNPNHVSYANDPPWNRFVHSAWVHSDNGANSSEWKEMVKRYTVLSDCYELNWLTYQASVMFFEGQAALRGGNLLQFCTIPPLKRMDSPTLLWPDRGLGALIGNQPNCFAPMGHPNEFGHKIISEHLIKEIDRAILASC